MFWKNPHALQASSSLLSSSFCPVDSSDKSMTVISLERFVILVVLGMSSWFLMYLSGTCIGFILPLYCFCNVNTYVSYLRLGGLCCKSCFAVEKCFSFDGIIWNIIILDFKLQLFWSEFGVFSLMLFFFFFKLCIGNSHIF